MIEVKPEYAGQEKKQQKSYTLYSPKVCIIEKCTVLAAFSQFFLPLSFCVLRWVWKNSWWKKSIDPFIWARARNSWRWIQNCTIVENWPPPSHKSKMQVYVWSARLSPLGRPPAKTPTTFLCFSNLFVLAVSFRGLLFPSYMSSELYKKNKKKK